MNTILSNYISSLGNPKHLASLKTLRFTGSIHLRDTTEDKPTEGKYGRITIEGKMPHFTGEEDIFQGSTDTMIAATDGSCDFDTSSVSAGYIAISPDSLESQAMACPLGPLYFAVQEKMPVRLVNSAYPIKRIVLRISFKSTRYVLVHLDAKTFRELWRDYVEGDYRGIKETIFVHRHFDGLCLPSEWQIMFDYFPIVVRYKIEKAELNVPLDQVRFRNTKTSVRDK